jgi:hypothetical protein
LELTVAAQQKVDVMQLGYSRPFSFQIGPRAETRASATTVSSVRPGVTEIALSDGRMVRATLQVKSVTIDPNKPEAMQVSYHVVAEVVAAPAMPTHDAHATVQ